MPTYDYVCVKHGHCFEAYQSMKDKPLTKCPKCKGKVQRQIGTGAGIIFKGAGFYATDYKKSSASPATESKTSETKSTESKPAEKKAESKKEAPKNKD